MPRDARAPYDRPPSDMTIERLSRDWDELAEEDALRAVLWRDGSWELEEFLATGEREVGAVLAAAEELGYPQARDRALDFGCGVGRLTRALSGHFRECVGVDVSAEMVRRAQSLNADRTGCTFVVNVAPDLRRFESGSFDLALSSKVLQHLPTRELSLAYVSELLRILRPAGIAVFQLWTGLPLRNRLQPRRRAYALLGSLGTPARVLTRLGLSPRGRGIAVPDDEVRAVIAQSGCRVVRTEPDGEWGLRYFVVAEARGTRP